MRPGAGAPFYLFQQFRGFGCGDLPARSRGRCNATRLDHAERLCPVHHGCPDRTHPSGRAFCGRLRHNRSRRTGPVPCGRADLSVGLYTGTGPVHASRCGALFTCRTTGCHIGLPPQRRAGWSPTTARNRPPPGPCHSWDPRRFCRNRCRFRSATYLRICRATRS